MPKTTKSGQPKKEELPSTLRRSDAKAQRTFAEAHDAAAEQYGDEERAHRVAFADRQAEGGVGTRRKTAGGVDANASKAHLMDLAKRLGVRGRSRMTKAELVDALQTANDRATAKARGDRS
jgi:ChaB/Rho termination factor, N-terminal domain